jgi:DNA-binding winged helix-turn-helix (wHTH) protein
VQIIFEGHRVDTGTRQLFRGASAVHLSPKAFDLLQLLVENHTRALSKAELHDRLWPGTFVTEANLASLIAEVRRALHDPPQSSRFVRTVPRFGYAFCGTIAADSDTPAVSRTCWIVLNGREIPMQEGENVIGRDPDATVRIDAPSVSRRHARVVVTADNAVLEDLGSKNGTFLRNQRLFGTAALADLDELQIGSVRMLMRIIRGSEVTQTIDR